MKSRIVDMSIGMNGKQRITIELNGDFREIFEKLKDADVNVDIKKWREPRSKDANAYFHVLVNKIAEVQSLSDTEVKRRLVLEYGVHDTDANGMIAGAMLPLAADVDRYWPYAKCYKTMELEGKEYRCYLFYKHTSDMDTKEMARLIDGAITEARELGIDTDTPEQRARYEYQKEH